VPDEVRETLLQIVKDRGVTVLDDPVIVKALLADLCPDSRAERYVIVTALELGVRGELRSIRRNAAAAAIDRIATKLRKETGIGEQESLWAVQSIAIAAGVVGTEGLATLHKPVSSPASSTPPSLNPKNSSQNQSQSFQPNKAAKSVRNLPPQRSTPVQNSPPALAATTRPPHRTIRSIWSVIKELPIIIFVWWLGCIPIYFVLYVLGRSSGLANHAGAIDSLYVIGYGLWLIAIIVYQVRNQSRTGP